MMVLVDEGKVGLDTPAVRYLPEFAMADPRFGDITIRMLLNHTSGIPGTNWENGMGFELDPEYQRTNAKKAPATAPQIRSGRICDLLQRRLYPC